MNYRHVYHAGNFADVFKHVVLLTLLRHLHKKPQPFCYLDTHAGSGRYLLSSPEAQRTLEYSQGIGRLYAAADLPPLLADYVERVRGADAANSADALLVYPGSPLIAQTMLRPQDRAVLMELHPADAASLKALFRGNRQVAVHAGNGYHGLKAFLPPPERRGLVLIDPPAPAASSSTACARQWAAGRPACTPSGIRSRTGGRCSTSRKGCRTWAWTSCC